MKIAGKWKRYRSPVWERSDGLRIHRAGLVVPKLGDCARQIPEREVDHWRRIVGGSRRRALMAWANNQYPLKEGVK